MKKCALVAVATFGLFGNAFAGHVWFPNATDPANAGEYTVKRVWQYGDGNNFILQVELQGQADVPNYGCTNARKNTFYMYSNPYSGWQQEMASKITLAQASGYKIKIVSNVGASMWCHNYGIGIWGVEVVVPPQ